MRSLHRLLALTLLLLGGSAAWAGEFRADWQGERVWVGPEYWTCRWQDWRTTADGRLRVESRKARSCVVLSRQVTAGEGTLELATTIQAEPGVNVPAGFWVGVNGPVAGDWRSAGAYGECRAFAGVRPNGTLVLRDAAGKRSATSDGKLSAAAPIDLRLTVRVDADRAMLELSASQQDAAVRASLALSPADVQGLIGLGTTDVIGAPIANTDPAPGWLFSSFRAAGDVLAEHDDRAFGPIGWTQYTCVAGVLKLTAQMMPVAPADAQIVSLAVDQSGKPTRNVQAKIDPVSRTAHFRVEGLDTTAGGTYRVSYDWRGKTYTFDGKLRPEPQGNIAIAVMSCDWGYAFPNAPLVASATHNDPDLLFYAGDQIYEHFGKFGVEREPLERSAIDYLRKYALFGWVNRDLLRDRPSIIIPDDHDAYQGNIWGAAGRKQPPGGDEMGGYRQAVEWVNAMQRTQTWHLPDAVDPTPVQQGITVYYGGFVWGGVNFVVLEDRKWKTGFRSIWGKGVAMPTDARELDPPGAHLLGERQEQFLADWGRQTPELVHVAVSQTIFAMAHTHGGPELKRSNLDKDSNGWPHTPRNRAVRLLGEAKAIHLCGDQHFGLLAQLGADNWTDGPLTFMAPGTANGWPRARWPDKAEHTSVDGGSPLTGRHLDGFGNQLTVYAVANPEPNSNQLKSPAHTPDEIARRKGSGYGIVRVDPAGKRATFEMWRFGADPQRPTPDDQFEGFPQTFVLSGNNWVKADK